MLDSTVDVTFLVYKDLRRHGGTQSRFELRTSGTEPATCALSRKRRRRTTTTASTIVAMASEGTDDVWLGKDLPKPKPTDYRPSKVTADELESGQRPCSLRGVDCGEKAMADRRDSVVFDRKKEYLYADEDGTVGTASYPLPSPEEEMEEEEEKTARA